MLFYLLISSAYVTVTLGSDNTFCPDGMWRYEPEDVCLLHIDTAQTKDVANSICNGYNGVVVMIKTSEKETFIANQLGATALESIWMGLEDPERDDIFTYADGGSLSSYQPWRALPELDTNDYGCAIRVLDTVTGQFGWDTERCEDSHTFICDVPPYKRCPERWHVNPDEDACIRPIKGRKRTFQGARAYCQMLGGDLAVNMTTESQRSHANRYIGFRGHFWVGVHSPSEDGNFVNLDGENMDDSAPFKRGRRNNNPGNHCVSMKLKKWYSRNCNRRHFFICQTDVDLTQTRTIGSPVQEKKT